MTTEPTDKPADATPDAVRAMAEWAAGNLLKTQPREVVVGTVRLPSGMVVVTQLKQEAT